MFTRYPGLIATFPESKSLLNWYARTASLANDPETAREAFALIGENWCKDCWGSLAAFEKARSAAQP